MAEYVVWKSTIVIFTKAIVRCGKERTSKYG